MKSSVFFHRSNCWNQLIGINIDSVCSSKHFQMRKMKKIPGSGLRRLSLGLPILPTFNLPSSECNLTSALPGFFFFCFIFSSECSLSFNSRGVLNRKKILSKRRLQRIGSSSYVHKNPFSRLILQQRRQPDPGLCWYFISGRWVGRRIRLRYQESCFHCCVVQIKQALTTF